MLIDNNGKWLDIQQQMLLFLDKDKILSINVFCLYQHFFVKNRNEERIWKNEK